MKPNASSVAASGAGSWNTLTIWNSRPSSRRACDDARVPVRRRMIGGGRRRIVRGINDVGKPVRGERAPHHGPEGGEACRRDMRQPEAHEHAVVSRRRLPREEIRFDVFDVARCDALAIDRDDFGRRIDGRHAIGVWREVTGEKPSAAREFEHARRPRCRERRDDGAFDDRDVRSPSAVVLGAAVEATRPVPPRVVLGGARPVVRDLPGQQRRVGGDAGRIVTGKRFLHRELRK